MGEETTEKGRKEGDMKNIEGEEIDNKKSALARLIDEMHLEKERELRLYSAFTFGTKLNKDHKPERHQYFQNMQKIWKSRESLGLSKENFKVLVDKAMNYQKIYEKYNEQSDFER